MATAIEIPRRSAAPPGLVWDGLDLAEHRLCLRVPVSAHTLEGFVEWVTSDEFPDKHRVAYLKKELFFDMSPEEIETHAKVKAEVGGVVNDLNKRLDKGEFFPDRTLFTNEEAEISTEADGLLVTYESYEAGRVTLRPREDIEGQYIEVRGSPDWVMEIVSRSSWEKDTVILREAYHHARIGEYWLINAMEDDIDLKILVWRKKGYIAVRPQGGWVRSPLFQREFRLERRRNRMGRWTYTLRIRPIPKRK